MPTRFLSTKFFVPRPRKVLVQRDQLFNLLNDGILGKLILVSAPAGYGKTTLITAWLKNQSLPVAWLSVDEADNDFYGFFGYLLEAIHQKVPQVGETLLQMLQSSMPPSQDSFVGLILHEIAALSRDCILVIDDYHLIDNPAIHSTFSQIIENSPKEIHFIICSRTELPFSVSRLRASDELLELTQRDLSLDLSESTLYMNMVMGAGLQPVDIAVLQNRTEGWLVGMQLAALSLRGLADPVSFIHSLKGDNRYIGDYLVDEVLSFISPDLLDFLLRTSVLSQMETSLCNYVLQIENSQELLESIDKQRLFIMPLDDNRQWFRYHHLFREMLSARLVRKSPEIVAALYQRASTWHAGHESKEDAVDYALEGKDYDRAATLIEETGLNLLSQGGWNRLLNWYALFPEADFHKHYELWLLYFMTLINTGLIVEAAKRIGDITEKDVQELALPEEKLIRLKGELAAARGVIILHSQVDPGLAGESLKLARKYLAGDNTFRFAFANNNYGICCLLMGEVDEARETFERNVSWGRKNALSQSRVMGTSYLAEAMALAGNLVRADELYRETVQFVHEVGLQEGAVFSKANLGLGVIYYEWNKLDEARNYLTDGLRLAEQGGYLNQLLPGCATLARILNLQGDLAGVQGTIQRARKLAEKYGDPPAAISFINAIEADMALQRGALFIVDNWLAYRQYHPSTEINFFSQYEQATLVRVLAAKEDYASLTEVLKPMLELALRQGRMKDAISYNVIMARCLFMKGEPLPAMAILQRALYNAEPNHLVRSFLDEGGVAVSMIKQLLASGPDRKQAAEECSNEYLFFLLDQVAKTTLNASSKQALPGGMAGVEPLTEHELHILRMLEAGYQNKQIAQELNISLNTVKYHLKNIFGKLGVVNRTQAARILRKEAK
jgi:LuxR family maltose regulon positive regulatory protein